MRHLVFGATMVVTLACVSCDESPEQTTGIISSVGNSLVVGDAPTTHSTAASQPTADQELPAPYLRVQDDRFIDAEGRQVLLHGMNVISKSKQENYLSWHRLEDFAKMRAWGMNCIRLGILWDGIEPKPGEYDETYLDGVAERVAWAAEHELYVFLDMHQDLFSVLYSDGAPAWATLHEDKPHHRGAVWSDSYLTSPAVQVAFDNFWANAPAPDGVGIQDHYAAAWRHVAERFANNPAIIGYDIMNEPFEGTSVMAGQASLLQSEFGTMLAERLGDSVQSPEQIIEMWLQPDGRSVITKHLEDVTLYEAFVDAQTGPSQAFEKQHLQQMYQRVADAIRTVDAHHILLLETSYHCNTGVYSAIEPVTDRTGERDPLQAYVPHAYDIVVDTPDLANANTERVAFIFQRHSETAKRLGMPMIIGEWGALGGADERILPSARVLQRQFEELLCGDTYWDYGAAIEKKAYFQALKRSIPNRISGTLLEYASHPETGGFTCRWKEAKEIKAPTIIYLTEAAFKDRTVHLEPGGTGFQPQPASDAAGDVYLSIPPTGKSVERLLTIK